MCGCRKVMVLVRESERRLVGGRSCFLNHALGQDKTECAECRQAGPRGEEGGQARADQVLGWVGRCLVVSGRAVLRCAVTAPRAGVPSTTVLQRGGRRCYARVQADDLQAGLVSGAEASCDSRRRAGRRVERTLSVGKQQQKVVGETIGRGSCQWIWQPCRA